MKRKILLIAVIFTAVSSNAQIKFEKGHFISNDGSKTTCLIKNEDWKKNPLQFEYKLSENSEINTKTIQNVKVFEINNSARYEKHTVNIDRSKSKVRELTTKRTPDYIKSTLFLKLLVAGKGNLYVYNEDNLTRYFFSIGESAVKQLEYKKYLNSYNSISENTLFKLQLKKLFSCKDLKTENLTYKKESLVSYFKKHNTCFNSEIVYTEKDSSKKKINIYAKIGINSSGFTLRNNDLGSKTGFQVGVEAEYMLPFNKGKWALFIEPTYHNYSVENFDVIIVNPGSFIHTNTVIPLSFKSNLIKTPIGLKHYLFLNKKSKIFFSAGVVLNLNISTKIDFVSTTRTDLETISSVGLTFGAGYIWNSRYSINVQLFTPNRFNTNGGINSDAWDDNSFKTASISFGYKLF
jgi:hypothetical protein